MVVFDTYCICKVARHITACEYTPLCKKILLSWLFFGQSLRKWRLWQAVADYSSWQGQTANRQDCFYTTVYFIRMFLLSFYWWNCWNIVNQHGSIESHDDYLLKNFTLGVKLAFQFKLSLLAFHFVLPKHVELSLTAFPPLTNPYLDLSLHPSISTSHTNIPHITVFLKSVSAVVHILLHHANIWILGKVLYFGGGPGAFFHNTAHRLTHRTTTAMLGRSESEIALVVLPSFPPSFPSRTTTRLFSSSSSASSLQGCPMEISGKLSWAETRCLAIFIITHQHWFVNSITIATNLPDPPMWITWRVTNVNGTSGEGTARRAIPGAP